MANYWDKYDSRFGGVQENKNGNMYRVHRGGVNDSSFIQGDRKIMEEFNWFYNFPWDKLPN